MLHIDMVRERAAGPGDNGGRSGPRPWSWLKRAGPFRTSFGERRAELACEGDRWFDLVRSGRANASLFVGDGNKEANFDPEDLAPHRL